MYLEGFGKLNSKMSFIETSPNENVIDFTINSHLTSIFTKEIL